tara:strand:+ start:12270 stop:12938 length:669 start_codon:yes stop_codon:yes gene_type:complete
MHRFWYGLQHKLEFGSCTIRRHHIMKIINLGIWVCLWVLSGCVVPANQPLEGATPAPVESTTGEPAPAEPYAEPTESQTAGIFIDSNGGCSTRDMRGSYERGASTLALDDDTLVCAAFETALTDALQKKGHVVLEQRGGPANYVVRIVSQREVATQKSGGMVSTMETVVRARTELQVDQGGVVRFRVETNGDAKTMSVYTAIAMAELAEKLAASGLIPARTL